MPAERHRQRVQWLDLTLPAAAENLAFDEVLLDWAEAGKIGETLRFWEPQSYFVVVGYGNRIGTEVNEEFCKANGIPVLRRCSGGGTVLQGPGVLNYALVLRADEESECATIQEANRFVMESNQSALRKIAKEEVRIEGCTDLAIGRRKFSGNAQRRRKDFLLFHGTFLLNADLGMIERALRMPSRQPEYRGKRGHGEFLMNLQVPSAAVKAALIKEWGARVETGESVSRYELPAELIERYGSEEWNRKFE